MPEQTSHEEYVAAQRRRVAELARDILAGNIDVLEGSAEIVSLRDELDIDRNDDDLLAFVVVDSETDALPIGAEAHNWSRDALIRKRPELERARSWAIDVVRDPCQNLVTRFGDVQQLVGPERRVACFASSLVRRRLREFAPPGQL